MEHYRKKYHEQCRQTTIAPKQYISNGGQWLNICYLFIKSGVCPSQYPGTTYNLSRKRSMLLASSMVKKKAHRLVGPLVSAISRFDRQQSTMGTHMLRSQEYTGHEVKSSLLKQQHSLSGDPRTGIVSRVQIQLTTEATHTLESQGQALSAGFKSSSPWKPHTIWRAKDRHHQQCPNTAHHGSHSHPGESRIGVVSRVQIQLTTEATHILESQG